MRWQTFVYRGKMRIVNELRRHPRRARCSGNRSESLVESGL